MMLILPCVGRSHQDRTGQDRLMLIGRCLSNGMKTVATHGQSDGSTLSVSTKYQISPQHSNNPHSISALHCVLSLKISWSRTD